MSDEGNEFLTPAEQGAAVMKETFDIYMSAGFSELQAIQLIAVIAVMTSGLNNQTGQTGQ